MTEDDDVSDVLNAEPPAEQGGRPLLDRPAEIDAITTCLELSIADAKAQIALNTKLDAAFWYLCAREGGPDATVAGATDGTKQGSGGPARRTALCGRRRAISSRTGRPSVVSILQNCDRAGASISPALHLDEHLGTTFDEMEATGIGEACHTGRQRLEPAARGRESAER